MAFDKTSNPWCHIDDTPANVVAELIKEKPRPENVFMMPSNTAGKIFCIYFKGSYA